MLNTTDVTLKEPPAGSEVSDLPPMLDALPALKPAQFCAQQQLNLDADSLAKLQELLKTNVLYFFYHHSSSIL